MKICDASSNRVIFRTQSKIYDGAFKMIDKKRLQVVDPVTVQEHVEEYEMESKFIEPTIKSYIKN